MEVSPQQIALVVLNIHPCDNPTCTLLTPKCDQKDKYECLPMKLKERAMKNPKFANDVMPIIAMITRDRVQAALLLQVILAQ